MCGIFGYTGKNREAEKLVLNGIKNLEYRGYDSWGIASIDKNGKIRLQKNIGKIGLIKENKFQTSHMAFGHTRWATHGGVTVANAHPHLDCTGTLSIIHNGIIENYLEIKAKLISQGHIFKSETDTEVGLHLIESLMSNGFKKAVFSAFKQFKGLNAIIVLDAQSLQFAAAKNGSPLIIGKGDGENFLASDAHALLPYTRNLYFMEDNEMILINDKNIKVLSLKDNKEKNAKFIKVDWDLTKEDKGKFPHFMLKEIYDQVNIIENIASSEDHNIKQFSNLISNSFGTYLVGCGTASYACLTGTYLFSKIAKVHINYSVASEFGYLVDFLSPKSLVVGLSQSGETIDLIDAVNKSRKKGAKIASIVNVLGSTLYRISDEKLLLGAGSEKAVVSTKAFTAKLAYLLLIAFELANKLNEGRVLLQQTVKTVKSILSSDQINKIKNLADLLYKNKHIYIIGRGSSFPIALETALKIKEASYIHAEGFAGGELKHGVIALVEKNTPCIAFLPNDESYSDTLSGVMEMKARGGYMIGIGYKRHEIFDLFIETGDCGPASVIPNVIVGQLLGYFLAVKRGLDPDKPRNLAKSVVVK